MLESLSKRKEEGYWSQKGNQLCRTHLGSEVLEVSPEGQLTGSGPQEKEGDGLASEVWVS